MMERRKADDVVVNKYGDGVAWCRGGMIGKGSFGSVYLATLKNPRSKYSCFPSIMAVKSAEVSVSGSIQKEREVLSNVKGCGDIIKCYGEETTTGENGVMVYNLLLEYGSGGTLAEKIKKSGGNGLPEFEVKGYTRSILRGLNHVHGIGYVHCDLKPDNILLVPWEGGVFTAKIGDFGLAKRAKRGKKKRKLEPYWRGTPMYLSPEVVVDNVQETPSDIWALGCIVLEMLTGKPPWGAQEELRAEDILKKIEQGNEVPKIPAKISKEARDFLKGCFVRKDMYRLTADMLLNHQFLEGLADDHDVGNSQEFEVVEDSNGIESILVVSECDDELGYDSFSDDCDYASEEDSFSYWFEEDVDGVFDFDGEESQVEEIDEVLSSNIDAAFDQKVNKSMQAKSQVPLENRQPLPVSVTIRAGV